MNSSRFVHNLAVVYVGVMQSWAGKAHLCIVHGKPWPVQVYLYELEQTAGTAPLPSAALRVLNSKACRFAVMFGALQSYVTLAPNHAGFTAVPGLKPSRR